MPPSITQLNVQPEADLISIEARIESNMREIAYLKSEQRNFAERLETLHESQQILLKQLNAIKSENYIQEINSLRAEKQLLQPDSGIFSGGEAPDTTPTPSRNTVLPSSFKNKRKAAVDAGSGIATRRIKTEQASLVAKDESNQDLRFYPTNTESSSGDSGSSATLTDITVWLNHDTNELELDESEDEATQEAWKRDGGRLRAEWKKQLKEFDKKNPMWANYTYTAGCVRSALWNQGKCYLTMEKEGDYACKTCWNTGHFCVAYEEDSGEFWLCPQLPAARTKGKSNIGPFDLEMFHSMKTAPSRTDLPAYWKKESTS
ncbi:hypothetical protein QM012_009389 [Aureobasidium pullulans]|uniref:Uncharacterized protein n=1 Tax=Aureobasidium pullulans TaxID=5580 RepID=A0ABR0TGQ0_AURPU